MHKCVFLTMLILLLTVGCGGEKPKYTEEELANTPFAQRDGLPEVSGGIWPIAGQDDVRAVLDLLLAEALLEQRLGRDVLVLLAVVAQAPGQPLGDDEVD